MNIVKNIALRIVQRLLLNLNLRLDSMSSFVAQTTSSIGALGAADALSHYTKNYEVLSHDKDLRDFMRFYSNNFSKSSSQWSQDIFVIYASKEKRFGLFLEIGGADGFTHSNTYSLEQHYEWQGTLIEPDRSQFSLLKALRSNNSLINAAISPGDKEETLNLRCVGQLSALQGHEGEDMHIETRLNSRRIAQVKCVSLSKILCENNFDYFSLDVEGAELAILRNIKWNSINKPSIITVEHNFREEDKREMLALLTAQGYSERFAGHDWLRRGDIWATLQKS